MAGNDISHDVQTRRSRENESERVRAGWFCTCAGLLIKRAPRARERITKSSYPSNQSSLLRTSAFITLSYTVMLKIRGADTPPTIIRGCGGEGGRGLANGSSLKIARAWAHAQIPIVNERHRTGKSHARARVYFANACGCAFFARVPHMDARAQARTTSLITRVTVFSRSRTGKRI